MAPLPHQYHPDIPFTEPPVDEDEDTRPYEWTPPLQEPVATHDEQRQARRVMADFIAARRTLLSVEGEYYAAVDYHGLAEEPIEPDALMALERQRTNWLATGVRSLGRTVFRRCNDVAAWLERGA